MPVAPGGKLALPVLPIQSAAATLRPAHVLHVLHAQGMVTGIAPRNRMVSPRHHV